MNTLTAAASKLGLSLSPEKPATAAEEAVPDDIACKRPESVTSFIGQDRVRVQLKMHLDAAAQRSREASEKAGKPVYIPPGHVCFTGPPGNGKTSLAGIIAHETGGNLVVATASAVRTPKNLGRWLARLKDRDVAFIDEIHGLPILAEELLYTALEDRRIEVIVGDGTKSEVRSIPLAKFTLVGATTDSGKISAPLRRRFKLFARLEYYTVDQLAEMILNFALEDGTDITEDACLDIARRSRGTAAVARTLYEKSMDFALVMADGTFSDEMVAGAMELEDIDSAGLTVTDRDVLRTLCKRLKGGPVGLNNLATTSGVKPRTVENEVEPFLVWQGMMVLGPRGRCATAQGFRHLGLPVPPDLMF